MRHTRSSTGPVPRALGARAFSCSRARACARSCFCQARQALIKAGEELLEQAETQFKVNNVMGQYGAYGLLEKARAKLDEAGAPLYPSPSHSNAAR